RLVWTITAFTIAHSLTLASSVLGLFTLRSAPVEAVIAMSIVLAASEAMNPRPTLTRRLPAMVAFLFGLVHGLGFAGVLEEIGLPEQHALLALGTFNLGVEIGQLGIVVLAFGIMLLARRMPMAHAARRPALLAIGTIAAFWSFDRFAAIVA
ncbi:MAG TPA: HupE/UreJ family protein, partial [Steroidobacteraceae bacterium]|nr:HupE/UreJ family protein [Steroidobacteraceae bacterium]